MSAGDAIIAPFCFVGCTLGPSLHKMELETTGQRKSQFTNRNRPLIRRLLLVETFCTQRAVVCMTIAVIRFHQRCLPAAIVMQTIGAKFLLF